MARNPKNTRMCTACRERKDKNDLFGLCLTKEAVVIKDGAHTEGRSVYVCKSEKCIALAEKKNCFSRSLKCETEPHIFDALRKKL